MLWKALGYIVIVTQENKKKKEKKETRIRQERII